MQEQQTTKLTRALAAVHDLGQAARGAARLRAPRHETRRAVYQAIIRWKEQHGGDSPTVDELRAATGLRSKATVAYHLRGLEAAGLIRRARGRGGIDVVGGAWAMSADIELEP